MRILVADDDPVVREVVRRYLERDGLEVVETADGPQTAAVLARNDIDLAILDVMMPPPDGIDLVRMVRGGSHPDTPIILLTALGEEDDRVLGLQSGADDYVTKPFSPRELALRVASVLRRARPAPSTEQVLRSGDIEVRPAARAVQVAGVPVELTAREFDLLTFLLTHPHRVFSRDELLAEVWGWTFGDLSTVTVHIKRLRAKLGAAHRIDTVWGRGYAWGRTDSGEDTPRAD
ncbi:response regulator transcription factor [Nocardia otitidiscaviarum]|uniref:response regulator transcription factor n=1 Tax=Nocardia otitidiscaviarum TaxID=1823 RepID=UPI0004A6C336|nr:response regulator transcription factor [Nocardia otitidiscaviarum]MBF6134338.1 response regulator transcription factor [Nocardia otitidiscaviarum]MBF6239792.1 response regulator transcription factor [Nocardia otitidiscaviarum]MBF6486036.1 response regulator transcription factor [Nocardia otitidiscaviarum]